MTVIAWDGKTLAADKRMVNCGRGSTCTKLYRVGENAVAFSGDADGGREMLVWFRAGADPDKFPARCRHEKDWTLMVVANKDGLCFYERTPYPVQVEDPFFAAGSGGDYAMAAMHLGKTAREAAEIACLFDTGCGNGIDELHTKGQT